MRDEFAFLRDTESPLWRIAVLMQCEPDDDDDLVEAVRLLVSERDNAMRTLARVQRELKQALDDLARVRETGKVEFKPLADLLRDEP